MHPMYKSKEDVHQAPCVSTIVYVLHVALQGMHPLQNKARRKNRYEKSEPNHLKPVSDADMKMQLVLNAAKII